MSRHFAHHFIARVLLAVLGAAGVASPTAAPVFATAEAQAQARGSLAGVVMDSSGGVLPGVLVSVTSTNGAALASTVTDGRGEFNLADLPAGSVNVSFHLDGFIDAVLPATVGSHAAGGRSEPLVQRMSIATMAETVIVRGDLPTPPPPPPAPPPIIPVVPHDENAVCAPGKVEAPMPGLGVLRASRKDPRQRLFATGDEVVVEGGTATGLAVGQNYVVRRRYPTSVMETRTIPMQGEHASGLIQIVSVDEQLASAVVVYACDALMTGDYLTAFEPPPFRAPEPYGRPVFDKAVRILFADAGETLGLQNRRLVIARGQAQGVRAGQRFTLFRKSRYGQTIVGQAVVVAVRGYSSTVHVEHATDVVYVGMDGDWAAPQVPQVSQR